MNRRVGMSFALCKEGIRRGLKWAFSGGEPMSALDPKRTLARDLKRPKADSHEEF